MLSKLLKPTLLDILFAALLLAAFARTGALEALLADGDTGWHIRTGQIVLATGHAPTVDPFSFSRGGQPWMAWEWLAGIVFAAAYAWRGLAGVAALAGGLLALAAALLLGSLLRRGCGLWLALGATLAAVSASSIHFLARPHVFSILFYTIALGILAEDRRRPGRAVWILAPLTAVWVNLHGGFVAWLATLGLLVILCATRRDRAGLRRYGPLFGLCSFASLLNPYGWRLDEHIATYLNSSWILDHVQEFQSPQIRSEATVVFALMLLGTVAVAWRGERFEGLLVIAWGFAALRSARHIPFFAIAAAPVLASAIAAAWKERAVRSAARAPVRILWEIGQDLGRNPRFSLWSGAAVAMAIATLPGGVTFPKSIFPVDAVERNIHTIAPAASMPRILTSDQWADYLIFRLYPRQKVFFDGRSDFFGPKTGAEYRNLLNGRSDWRKLLDRYNFRLALLPRDESLSAILSSEPGWRLAYSDNLAVLYVKEEQDSPPWTSNGSEMLTPAHQPPERSGRALANDAASAGEPCQQTNVVAGPATHTTGEFQ